MSFHPYPRTPIRRPGLARLDQTTGVRKSIDPVEENMDELELLYH
jgi:hypothetical protein